MNYQQLLSTKDALEKEAAVLQEQIDLAHKAERAQILAQIDTLMAQYGITAADLGALRVVVGASEVAARRLRVDRSCRSSTGTRLLVIPGLAVVFSRSGSRPRLPWAQARGVPR